VVVIVIVVVVVVVVVVAVVVVVEGQMSSNVLFPGALPLASAGVGGYYIFF
jgi:hypothetical protein